MIEITPPEVSITELPEFINTEKFDVSWEAQDKESGVACYDVEFREGEKASGSRGLTTQRTGRQNFQAATE